MWLHTVTIDSYRRSEDCADFILSIKQSKSFLLWLVPEDGSIATLLNVAVHRLTQRHIIRQDRCEKLHQKQELIEALTDYQFPNARGSISCYFTITPLPPMLPDFRKALLVLRVTLRRSIGGMVLTSGKRSRPTERETCPLPFAQHKSYIDWLVSKPDFRAESNLKYIKRPSPYRAVITLRLGYKSQSVNAV
jgi:hypothetical protein